MILTLMTFLNNITVAFYGSIAVFAILIFYQKLSAKIKTLDETDEGKPILKFLKNKIRSKKQLHLHCTHRGGNADAPENTLLAYSLCKNHKTDILEFDLRATKDGHIVLLHDDTVDRTTNGKGLVSNFTLSELKNLDAAYHFKSGNDKNFAFSFRNKNHKIPTLEEALELTNSFKNKCGEPLIYIFDFKTEKVISKSLELIKKFNLENRVIFSANSFYVNQQLYRYKPKSVPLSVDINQMTIFVILNFIGLGGFVPLNRDIYGAFYNYHGIKCISRRLIDNLHKRNKLFVSIGEEMSDEKILKRMMDFEVDFLLSDNPVLLRKVLDSKI